MIAAINEPMTVHSEYALTKQSPLTLRYTRMALSNRFRRRLQEGLSYGLVLEGISAAEVARLNAQKERA
jgi:hypothetical protein